MAPVKIYASRLWNPAGIMLEAGKTYIFSGSGSWNDWFVSCGVEGYSKNYLTLFEPCRRAPQAQWFSLIGCYGKALSGCFDLGAIIAKQGGRYTAQHTGELFCFANDMPGMYWNNRGYVELTIRQES